MKATNLKQHDSVLSIDCVTSSGTLLHEAVQMPMFNDDGQPATAADQVINFRVTREALSDIIHFINDGLNK